MTDREPEHCQRPGDQAVPADVDALRREHYNAVILGERSLHDSVMVIRVRPDRPVPPPRPGQWMELGLGIWEAVMPGAEAGSAKRVAPDSVVRRAYSVSSPMLTPAQDRLLRPGEEEGIEFFLSLVFPPAQRAARVPNLTGRLFCLGEGDRLYMSEEPQGNYTLDPVSPGKDVLFLATGTGEAPHNRMIWELLRTGHPGRVASIVSVRHWDDLAYHSIHRRLTVMYPHYRYAAVATREPESRARHLQDLLLDGSLERMAGFPIDPGTTQIFLCGNPGMIGPPRLIQGTRTFPASAGMVELLEREFGMNADLRKPPANVHYERYW